MGERFTNKNELSLAPKKVDTSIKVGILTQDTQEMLLKMLTVVNEMGLYVAGIEPVEPKTAMPDSLLQGAITNARLASDILEQLMKLREVLG